MCYISDAAADGSEPLSTLSAKGRPLPLARSVRRKRPALQGAIRAGLYTRRPARPSDMTDIKYASPDGPISSRFRCLVPLIVLQRGTRTPSSLSLNTEEGAERPLASVV